MRTGYANQSAKQESSMTALLPTSPGGGMADATDSKSVVRKGVWVRLPLRAQDVDLPAAENRPGCCKSTDEVGGAAHVPSIN